MTPQQVTKKVLNKEDLFILDVRNTDAYEEWKIESESFSYLNIPYFDLLDGVEEITDQLPNDQDILVVCAKGGSSQFVGEMLDDAGMTNVYSLAGGMKAWSEYLEPIKVGDLTNGGELYQFVRVGKGCLSYMVISEGEAAVIDPSRMTNRYIDFAKARETEITHIFDTHLHADHISGGRSLSKETDATYWLPPKDAQQLTYAFKPLEHNEKVTIGNSTIDIHAFYSPGHTVGSTSFVIDEQYLMTGDILFIDSIGRPDLAGKAEDWVTDLRETLYDRYNKLSDDLIVLPAHFMTFDELNEEGTVAEKLGVLFEKNHGLTIQDQAEFRRLVTENLPPQPHAYEKIRETNMGKANPDNEEQREMEIGPNRCAIR